MSELQSYLKNFQEQLNILLKPFNFGRFSFLDKQIEYLKKDSTQLPKNRKLLIWNIYIIRFIHYGIKMVVMA